MSVDPKSGYYDVGGIETLKIIRAKLTRDQFTGFLLGTLQKYVLRANFKGVFIRDIEKANVYAKLLLDHLSKEKMEDRIK